MGRDDFYRDGCVLEQVEFLNFGWMISAFKYKKKKKKK